jgi:uncharacterized protein HemX
MDIKVNHESTNQPTPRHSEATRKNYRADSSPDTPRQVKKRKGTWYKPAFIIVLILLVLGLGGAVGYLAKQNIDLKNGTATTKAADDLKQKVGKLMQLPNETPTIATVSDASKLKAQAFFADAKNGDKLLIFTQAKKAVIYRESENKIINSGPIAITGGTAGTTTDESSAE